MRDIEQIKARLEAITPSAWIFAEPEHDKRGWQVWVDGEEMLAESMYYHDAIFVAYAPDDIRRLIERVEQLEAGMEKLLKVTGQSVHWPIEYENFVLGIARTALAEEDERG
jgi:hypothetical protein